ncbi:MAG: crotonase/enoyl-CoA hydratase family protein [Pseudomonadota bacterium]|nr:crotonase/enoyl-CoA hydratase family protein [Pseudomonadota bacterium]
MTYETLDIRTDDRGVLRLTLNRPDKHNSMNSQLITDMRSALAKISADTSVRVVVLTGAGESFCAGGDLGWMKSQVAKTRGERIAETRELALMLNDINSLNKPVIGRVNGQAFGGGIGMISVCDMTYGARGAKFALTEVRLGLIAATISPFVVRRMGEANARRVMLNCRFFDTDEAVALGLISEAVDPADLDAAVDAEVARILDCAPGAVAMTKALIHFVANHWGEDNVGYTADRLADCWETDEGKEGITCFLEKRKPSWRA